MFYAKLDDFILTYAAACIKAAYNVDAPSTAPRSISRSAARGSSPAHARLDARRERQPGVALAQFPPAEVRLGRHYDDKTWSFGALVHVVDDRKRVHVGYGNIAGQDLGPTPGFIVFSVNASVRPFRNARISAGVDNIFVKTYAEHSLAAASPSPLWKPPHASTHLAAPSG